MEAFLAVSSLIAVMLSSAGCNMTSEAAPIRQAATEAAANAYVGPFSAMHAAIPAGAGTAVQEYYGD